MTEKKRGVYPCAFSVSELKLPERRFKSGKSGGFAERVFSLSALLKLKSSIKQRLRSSDNYVKLNKLV